MLAKANSNFDFVAREFMRKKNTSSVAQITTKNFVWPFTKPDKAHYVLPWLMQLYCC